MATYLEQLQAADPQAYQKLLGLMNYTASQNFGGTPQNWQAEIFAGLDAGTLANAPKTIDFNAATNADPNNRIIGNSEDNWAQVIGYKKPITTTSGTQIFAEYDPSGNLTGYSGNPMQRSFLSGNQSVSGRWDASGKATPQQYSSSGGGFLGGLAGGFGDIATDLAPMALKAAALYYGGQALGGALGGTEAAATGGGLGGYEAGAGGTNLFADAAIPGNAAELAGYGTGATAGAIGAGAAATGAAGGALSGGVGGSALQNIATKLGINAGLNTLFGGNQSGTRNMATDNTSLGNLFSGLLGGAGGVLQNRSNVNALTDYANRIAAAGQQAQQQTQFRPVGITNTFGSSQFTVDPTTGQLTSANYSLSPQLQAYQDAIMGANRQSLSDAAALQTLGRGYVAQSPEAAAQQWLKGQQALLAPSREQSWANLANQDYNRGTMGLKVAQGGNLQAANPYAAALANAQAQQDLSLASQAQQQGQAQTAFGQGLLSSAYQPFTAGLTAAQNVEQLGQQPFNLATQLGQLSSAAGARSGALGLNAATQAGGLLAKAGQINTPASILGNLGTSTTAGNVLGGLLGGTGVGNYLSGLFGGLNNAPSWTMGPAVMPESTVTGSTADNSWMNDWWMQ